MPRPGVPNNAEGVNSWQGFGDEEPYGQATKDASLARAAPQAGARVASGPIQAPKRAGRRAQRPSASPPATATPAPTPVQPEQVPYDVRLAQWWQGIAAVPGASELVQAYAAAAQQRTAGG